MRAFSRPFLIPLLVMLVSVPAAFPQENRPGFSRAEIDQMLAPIALYPDALLSQILMASTYPLEVVEAARWSKNNPGLEGAQAVETVGDKDWDPSVKALVAFPRLLARMDEDLEWTRRLGDAFLYQEAEVMDAVQELRERAYAAGNLDSLEHARAHREGEAIVIEPANSKIVHVPYYHPQVIYGGWWWPAYPPFYWGPPLGYYPGSLFGWSNGIRVAPGFFFSSFHWPRRHIVIVNVHKHPHKSHFRSGRDHAWHDAFQKWQHDPKHRRGVVYRHETLNRGFGRSSISGAFDAKVVAPQGKRHGHRGQSKTLESGLRQRPTRRADAGEAISHGSGGEHTHFHRKEGSRLANQSGQAQGPDVSNGRVASRENRRASGENPANIESQRSPTSSWNRDNSRATSQHQQNFRGAAGSFQSPPTRGRVGAMFK